MEPSGVGGVAERTGDHGCSRPGLRDLGVGGVAEICPLPLTVMSLKGWPRVDGGPSLGGLPCGSG